MSKVNHYSASECLENYLKRQRLRDAVVEAAMAEQLALTAYLELESGDWGAPGWGVKAEAAADVYNASVKARIQSVRDLLAFEAAQEAKPF